MHVPDVGGGGGATVRLLLRGRRRPPGLPALPVWDCDGAFLDHVVYHFFDLFETRLKAVLSQNM